MKLIEALKQAEIITGRAQLYEEFLVLCEDIESGKHEVFDKELGSNRIQICEEIRKELVQKIESLKTQVKEIHNSEVKIDTDKPKKPRTQKPSTKKTSRGSGNSGSRKGK